MPKIAKCKSINRANKWEQWYTKQDSKRLVFFFFCNLIYYQIIISSSSYLSFSYLVCWHQRRPNTWRSLIYIHLKTPITIYPKNIEISLIDQKQPPPKHMFKLMNNNTTLNLNIASYFINILDSSNVLTWYTTGGPITKTINHIGITKNHLRTVERTSHMVNMCKDMEQQYIVKNITKHFGQPYLLKNLDELNILADATETHLGLHCTAHMINCRRPH